MNFKSSKITKLFCATLAICLCFLFSINLGNKKTASANSAQMYWEGIDRFGAIVAEENCPLQVKNENLTFDLPLFPKNYYLSEEEFAQYNATVKAEYTFYNPSDYDVKATLLFPIGNMANYSYFDYNVLSCDNYEKYDILVNGSNVEKTIRHSLASNDFKAGKDYVEVKNDYVDDAFYKRNLLVNSYTFKFSGIEEKYNHCYASFLMDFDTDKTKIMVSDYNGFSTSQNGINIGKFVNNDDEITIYVIGQDIDTSSLEWTFYEDGGEKKKIAGNATLLLKKEAGIDFFSFANRFYDEEENVSKIDWYNAVVANLKSNESSFGHEFHINQLNVSSKLMNWYQYDIHVPANGEIVNSVSAPMYPSIDLTYSSPIYEYSYYLSPAKTWASFGTFNVEIKTPNFLIESTLEGFENENGVYNLSAETLPDGELIFSLCAEENPTKINDEIFSSIMASILISFSISIVTIVIAGGTTAVIILSVRKHRINKKINDSNREKG